MNSKENDKTPILAEIINLEAILNLPKGTEHFVSDLHGEYEAFQHILRSGSGNVKEKVTSVFCQDFSRDEINDLCFLIYYPEEKLQLKKVELDQRSLNQWEKKTIQHLAKIVRFSSSKYTRSKVRKAIPENFQYILEELIYPCDEKHDKEAYYEQIVDKIIQLSQGETFIIQLGYLIQRLVVDHLHVVGDIYDRGPAPDKIMDALIKHHSVDIQWGNHDLIWIGAFSGSTACMANVIRICARYENLDILENQYQINLQPLYTFANQHYELNPSFNPKKNPYLLHSEVEKAKINKLHQAITIIQFKLEGQLIKRRPEFAMDNRLLFEQIDFDKAKITLDGEEYPLINPCFSTVDPKNPYHLTPEEERVVKELLFSFQASEQLKKHISFLMKKGSLYLKYNGNLLLHGCIPLTESGELKEFMINKHRLKGKELLDSYEGYIRDCFQSPDVCDDFATDFVWYLWCGENSSLFGKKIMTTFERYFIAEKITHQEIANPYYKMRNQDSICSMILAEFGLSPNDGHIINGHTPVKEKSGDIPIKASGKMIIIDGGYSRAYQKTTGIGGYTLLFNSYGLKLVAHQPFISKLDAIMHNKDIVSMRRIVARKAERIKVKDTNIGRLLLEQSAKLMAKLHNELEPVE